MMVTTSGAPRAHRRLPADSGMTLIELLVAMGIFVVLIAVFMSGVVSMTRTTARAQGVSDATTSARKVLDLFDKQVRYSSALNREGFGDSGEYYYVEYLAPAQETGFRYCAQWRYDPTAHTLAIRTWTDSLIPSPSAWNIIAMNVRNAASKPPFKVTFASPTPVNAGDPPALPREQLTVTLDIGLGTQAGAQVSTTYVARNTSVNTSVNTMNIPQCRSGVGRP